VTKGRRQQLGLEKGVRNRRRGKKNRTELSYKGEPRNIKM
jgi:hypothetical protein